MECRRPHHRRAPSLGDHHGDIMPFDLGAKLPRRLHHRRAPSPPNSRKLQETMASDFLVSLAAILFALSLLPRSTSLLTT
ncbi:hypothetical protein PS2_003328 [Malus domestica]